MMVWAWRPNCYACRRGLVPGHLHVARPDGAAATVPVPPALYKPAARRGVNPRAPRHPCPECGLHMTTGARCTHCRARRNAAGIPPEQRRLNAARAGRRGRGVPRTRNMGPRIITTGEWAE